MAAAYKVLTEKDSKMVPIPLHESIPISGTILSGTYAENNIKNYGHAMYQKCFDYPYLSSSANDILDITMGYSSLSDYSSSANEQNAKKINMYNNLAQVLMGNDLTGGINEFDADGDIVAGGKKIREAVFVSFNRLLYKDEIKKGSFRIGLYVDGPGTPGDSVNPVTMGDFGADTDYKVNSPAGEYGLILTSSTADSNSARGLIFYQAGVMVFTGAIFSGSTGGDPFDAHPDGCYWDDGTESGSFYGIMTGSTIVAGSNGFRNRIHEVSFNNTTEVNSKIYYIRINHDDFNYSSNPTYVSSSRIVTKVNSTDIPVSYVTGIGLYSADNVLLATAKLSEPEKNSADTERIFRVRLDY